MTKKTINTTTIIGGKFRGKKILLPPVITTRSSKSRLKESFFNTIQFDVIDCNFVEMFAGSGGIGLEALSRGAKKIYFLEYNKTAFNTLQKNIASMDASRCEAIFGDSFENINTVVQSLRKNEQKAYFYIDPPFCTREGMEDIYDRVVTALASLPKEVVKMIIIEHMSAIDFEKNLGQYRQIKHKRFGKTSLSYYE